MCPVAYFTAVVAKTGAAWRARDVEVDEYDTLDDLADALRTVAVGDEPVLAVIEHEDEWFAVIRVDGDDEPRLFVSDLLASARSHYGHILASAADVDAEEEFGAGDEDDEPDHEAVAEEGDSAGDAESDAESEAGDDAAADAGRPEEDGDIGVAAEPDPPMLAAWAGELELLEDLGVSPRELRTAAEQRGDDPAAVLADLGEVVGFGELLEALR